MVAKTFHRNKLHAGVSAEVQERVAPLSILHLLDSARVSTSATVLFSALLSDFSVQIESA